MKNLVLASLKCFLLCAASVSVCGCTHLPLANAASSFMPCKDDKVRRDARSQELQAIVKADQDERQNWQNRTMDEMLEALKRDEARRKRVGEIFGEGCFAKAEDYAAAALVFQYGDGPDHFFQTFLWSKRGVELGDEKQKRMMALGIDRYLVSIGKRQLFGSQAFRPGSDPGNCWCLQKVEPTFPDTLRKQYADKTLAEAFDWLKELNAGKSCPVKECAEDLKPSPKGTVPGFW